jgi:hypothetical protein
MTKKRSDVELALKKIQKENIEISKSIKKREFAIAKKKGHLVKTQKPVKPVKPVKLQKTTIEGM